MVKVVKVYFNTKHDLFLNLNKQQIENNTSVLSFLKFLMGILYILYIYNTMIDDSIDS